MSCLSCEGPCLPCIIPVCGKRKVWDIKSEGIAEQDIKEITSSGLLIGLPEPSAACEPLKPLEWEDWHSMEGFPGEEKNHQESRIQKIVQEIHGLESETTVQAHRTGSFNKSLYSDILKNFNSAIMCTPRTEVCSELLQILERLEARVFTEAEEAIRRDGEETDSSASTFRSYEAPVQPPDVSVFEQQHPTSPVSGVSNLRSWSSLSRTSAGFISGDSFPSPESSFTVSTAESSMSEPSKKSGERRKIKSEPDVICFKRTVRRLDQSFGEGGLSPRSSESNTTSRRFEFLRGPRKSPKSNVKPANPLITVHAQTEETVRSDGGGERTGSNKADLACKPLILRPKASRSRLLLPVRVPKFQSLPLAMEATEASKKSSIKGLLHSVVRDGFVSYNLLVDETEELVVAREVNQDVSEDQEICDKVFVFLSYKSKEKGKRGWIKWGNKDKPAVEVVGKMKVYNTVIPEMDGGGKNRHFLDSDYVLFEGRKVKNQQAAPEFHVSPRRLSFSSWATATSESSSAPAWSPTSTPRKQLNSGRDLKSDSSRALEAENGNTSYTEVGGVVTRIPIQVKKRSTGLNSSQPNNTSWESRLKRNNPVPDVEHPEASYDRMSVTVVLPTGEHGCPSYGAAGPGSILERWRSGGLCDCEGWDLGCGFTVLENRRSVRCSAKAVQEQADSVKLVVQGKTQDLTLKLTPLYDKDSFTVSFQQPLSTIQAFGAAVAMLDSRAKLQQMERDVAATTKPAEPKKKLVAARAPARSPSGILQEAFTGFPKLRKVYSMGCHPEQEYFTERV